MKRKMAKKFLIVLALIFLLNVGVISIAHSDDLTHKIGVGLGYPYSSLKYGITPKWSAELRGAFGSGIIVFGWRLYHNFNPTKRTVIYCGGEIDYVSFDTENIVGNGYLWLIFIGGEHFLSKNFAVGLDIGPIYTKLNALEYSDISVSGIDWVVNIGVNFYFSVKR